MHHCRFDEMHGEKRSIWRTNLPLPQRAFPFTMMRAAVQAAPHGVDAAG